MAINPIDQWLKKPEYDSGVVLFKQYSTNAAKILFYETKVYKLPQLINDLKALRNDAVVFVEEKKVSVEKTAFKQTPKNLPPHILELKKQADKAWKEARDMHSNILLVRSKKKRHDMAKKILELVPFAFDNWKKVDQFEKTGSLSFLLEKNSNTNTDKKPINQMTLMEMINSCKNIPGYITKFKNQLQNSKGKEKTDYLMKMIAEKEAELSAINERILFLDAKIIELCL